MEGALFHGLIPELAFVLGFPAFAFWLEKKYPRASACVVCLIGGLILANLHIVPLSSPVYDQVFSIAVPLAIPLLLFSVDIRAWLKLAKPAVVSFIIACVAVMVITFIGVLLVDVGPEGWKVAGMLIGTYTGGSLNLAGVGTALEASSDIFVAANAADLLWFSLYIAALYVIYPVLVKMGWKSSAKHDKTIGPDEDFWAPKNITLHSLTGVIAIAAVIFAAASYIKTWFDPGIQSAVQVIALTTISLIVAQFKSVQGLAGNDEFGSYLLHMFFVAIGATSSLSVVIKAGPAFLLLVGVVVFGSLLVHLIIGRLLGLDAETLLTTSNAAIGGPTTAAAVAISMKWKDQIVTGLITGLMGYAVGNYLGIGIATLIKSMRPDFYTAIIQLFGFFS